MAGLKSENEKGFAICDTHFHIFGPFSQFPLEKGAKYVPDEATVADYKAVAASLGIGPVVVVQGGCYGTNNAAALNAVREIGVDRARAIAIIDDTFDDRELRRLHDDGVRGIRLNLISDRSIDSSVVLSRARKVASLGWHVQLHATASQMIGISDLVRDLPLDVVIDHCGYIDPRLGIDQPTLNGVLNLLQTGKVWIKLTSYRASASHGRSLNMEPIVRRLADAALDRCLWGTDWPHPLMSEVPDTRTLLDEFRRCISSEAATKILLHNPQKFYGFQM